MLARPGWIRDSKTVQDGCFCGIPEQAGLEPLKGGELWGPLLETGAQSSFPRREGCRIGGAIRTQFLFEKLTAPYALP